MTFAVVPAAGHSTRMGLPKLSLRLGDRTVIECVVQALRDGGMEHVVVVVGPHVRDLTRPAALAGADVCLLDDPTPDMRATVERGLRWLEERFQPQADDVWLLAPADHPCLDAGTIRQLIAATTESGSIVVPVHDGRRGHPTLLTWRHVAGIRALPPDAGINAYIRGQSVQEVVVSDPGILMDLDTPADWERIKNR